jgi:pseudaminic acid cytidylyltransferase|tara:strand:- start:645 stop:878 length:234 start_codon:yes stop_codon:yes gene_type:complete
MSSICIIPARRNSKRIKNKNTIVFYGTLMISYTIKAVKKSGCFDRILLSTVCLKISKIYKKYDEEIRFLGFKSKNYI